MALNKQQPLGLGDLSEDILYLICSQLCVHCCHEPMLEFLSGADDAEAEGLAALHALSTTSRLFRFVAQPMLYHRINVHLPHRLCRLIRTLDDRPDLAASVRQLSHHGGHLSLGGWIGDEELAQLKRIGRRLHMDHPNDPEFKEAHPDHCPSAPGSFCVQLLIALAPNLETLGLRMENRAYLNGKCFDFLDTRFRKLGTAGLPNLRQLQLGDGISGFYLSHPGIGVILGAAVNLERLVIMATKGVDGSTGSDGDSIVTSFPSLPRLRSLEFEDCAMGNDVRFTSIIHNLIQDTTQLERFRYVSQSVVDWDMTFEYLPPSKLIECLREKRESIKFLDLNIEDNLPGKFRGVEFTGKTSLSQFSNVETLKIDDNLICRHTRLQSLDIPENCLAYGIPQSTKTLVIRLFAGSLIWKDLAELADYKAAGRFPQLERVQIYAVWQDWVSDPTDPSFKRFLYATRNETESLQELYAKVSITLSVEGRGSSSYIEENCTLGMPFTEALSNGQCVQYVKNAFRDSYHFVLVPQGSWYEKYCRKVQSTSKASFRDTPGAYKSLYGAYER